MDVGCSKCNKGYIHKNGIVTRCECLLKQIFKYKYLKAGVGEQYHDITWQDFSTKNPKREQALNEVITIAKEIGKTGYSNKSICLVGHEGSGKRALASLIIMYLIRRGLSCKMASLHTLIAASFEQDIYDSEITFHNPNKHDAFCIDLGQEGNNKRSAYVLEHYYFARRARKKFTFFTSHLKFGEMNLRYGLSERRIFNRQQIQEIIL